MEAVWPESVVIAYPHPALEVPLTAASSVTPDPQSRRAIEEIIICPTDVWPKPLSMDT